VIVQPLSKPTALEIAKWRNVSRESLRTGWTTELQQEAFYEGNFKGNYKYWEFLTNVDQGGKSGVAVAAAGGFVNIDKKGGEIALIVHPLARKQGFGTECVEWILQEGFANLGYEKIWGEVYDCGAVSFWQKFIDKYGATDVKKDEAKYWNFRWHGSTIFSIDRGEYVKRWKERRILSDTNPRRDNRYNQSVSPDTRDGTRFSGGTRGRDSEDHGVEFDFTDT